MFTKTKKVCVLTEDNYFKEAKTLYRNSRCSTEFGTLENSYEIPLPNEEVLNNHIAAKWNFETENWEYDSKVENELNSLLDNSPMYYFILAKQLRLENVNEEMADSLLAGDFEKYEKLKKYKINLQELTLKMENTEIDEPSLVDSIDTYRQTKNPEDMIIFNWPEKV